MNIKDMLTPYKEILTLEIRYKDNPNRNIFFDVDNSVRTTIGVYDTYEEACEVGNDILENVFEKRFKLNPHYNNNRMRFGKMVFHRDVRLISDLGYIQTPFTFFFKIEKLNSCDVSQLVDEVVNAGERYKNYTKLKENQI